MYHADHIPDQKSPSTLCCGNTWRPNMPCHTGPWCTMQAPNVLWSQCADKPQICRPPVHVDTIHSAIPPGRKQLPLYCTDADEAQGPQVKALQPLAPSAQWAISLCPTPRGRGRQLNLEGGWMESPQSLVTATTEQRGGATSGPRVQGLQFIPWGLHADHQLDSPDLYYYFIPCYSIQTLNLFKCDINQKQF